MTTPLVEATAKRSVLVCVGAGGVGKTTVSAALALRSAADGKASLVCTIDPAKRLANSLGLNTLGNDEQEVRDEHLRADGVTLKAPLHAMMLDMKRAWDDLILRFAPADKRERILSNRFYKSLSTRLAGSQEYIAMQKLSELHASKRYPLIVLDTPPTVHALDFLDAPDRVLDFLDNEAAKWLLTPALLAGKVGLRLFNLGSSFMAKQISKLTGTETLTELANFMLELGSLNGEIREQAKRVRNLLGSNETTFVLVTAPHLERLDEVAHFHRVLLEHRMTIAAVVVNRVHVAPAPELFEKAQSLPEPLRVKALQTLEEARSAAARDEEAIQALSSKAPGAPLVRIPRFEGDVHDLHALWMTGRYLLGDDVLPAPGV